MFKGFKTTRKVWFMLIDVKIQKQGTIYIFRGQNATRKVQFMYLEVKMQQAIYE